MVDYPRWWVSRMAAWSGWRPGCDPPIGGPSLGGRHERPASGTVEALANDVVVAGMTSSFLDQVEDNPAGP